MMIELTSDELRQLIVFLKTDDKYGSVADQLTRALECLGLDFTTDRGILIMPAPEGSNFKLAEFAP